MHPTILALATSVPPFAFMQEEIAEAMVQILNLQTAEAARLRKLYRNSAIKKRHSVFPDFKDPRPRGGFWGEASPLSQPGTAARNAIYKLEAPKLAQQAAAKAMQQWGGSANQITHIISVSCTGMMAPGIEFLLAESLGLSPSVARLGINFMGCFGAFNGLAVSQALARENPNHRILLVCTELCSLHMQTDLASDTLVANSLFSDGAAAAIIGLNPLPHEKALWQMINRSSTTLQDTKEAMSWESSDTGFVMRLSAQVPRILEQHVMPFARALFPQNLNSADFNWAIHPGGKAILQAIERVAQLDSHQTEAAWQTLANYGNMSSATFLFVLDALRQQKSRHPWTLGLAFGPGLSMEGILLNSYE